MSKQNTHVIPNVVHESETQRQHIRIELPASVKIGGKIYKIANISAGGFGINTDKDFILPPGIQEAKILFPFDSFSFHLTFKATPVYFNRDTKIAGFSFHEMNSRQISLIHHLIKTYLSGYIIKEGDIINVVTRENFTAQRDEQPSNDNSVKSFIFRLLPLGLIFFAGALGIFILAGNFYESRSIIKSYMSMVGGDVFTVRAQANGIYDSLLPEGTETVRKNQPMAMIKTEGTAGYIPDNHRGIVIQSPCDCRIVNQRAQEGEFRALGDPIFELLPNNAQTWVIASLPPDQAHRLQILDDAHIKIAGGSGFIKGHVSEFLPPELDKEMAKVKITTDTPISPEFFGRLAYVEFNVQ